MEYVTINLTNPQSVKRGEQKKQILLNKGLSLVKEINGSRTKKIYFK